MIISGAHNTSCTKMMSYDLLGLHVKIPKASQSKHWVGRARKVQFSSLVANLRHRFMLSA